MNFLQKNLLDIFTNYKAPQPLSVFLKDFFIQNKKLGSRDRKAIREAVYTYFRWNTFLQNHQNPLYLLKWCINKGVLKNNYLGKMLEDIPLIELEVQSFDFPKLSGNLMIEDYKNYLLHQPSLFIRIEKKKESSVLSRLKEYSSHIHIHPIHHSNFQIIELPNAFPIQQYLKEYEYVVQDFASQMTIVKAFSHIRNTKEIVWDVCSGAGGKSIVIHQLFSPKKIFSFDIRPKILHNLRKRIHQYRIPSIEPIVHDWSKNAYQSVDLIPADIIVCDVPCTGSGTWARVPENISTASESAVDKIAALQASILDNVLHTAQDGAYILYITCSVFYKENEAQIERIQTAHTIEIICQELIFGEKYRSDSMFYCLFQYRGKK